MKNLIIALAMMANFTVYAGNKDECTNVVINATKLTLMSEFSTISTPFDSIPEPAYTECKAMLGVEESEKLSRGTRFILLPIIKKALSGSRDNDREEKLRITKEVVDSVEITSKSLASKTTEAEINYEKEMAISTSASRQQGDYISCQAMVNNMTYNRAVLQNCPESYIAKLDYTEAQMRLKYYHCDNVYTEADDNGVGAYTAQTVRQSFLASPTYCQDMEKKH